MVGPIMEVPINDLHGVTIVVRITRQFRIRFAIGTCLIRLASRIMKCEIQVDDAEEAKTPAEAAHS